MYPYKGMKSHNIETENLHLPFRDDTKEHSDLPWMVNFSVLWVLHLATFFLACLMTSGGLSLDFSFSMIFVPHLLN